MSYEWLPAGFAFELMHFREDVDFWTEGGVEGKRYPIRTRWICKITIKHHCPQCAHVEDSAPFCRAAGSTADEAVAESMRQFGIWNRAGSPWPYGPEGIKGLERRLAAAESTGAAPAARPQSESPTSADDDRVSEWKETRR
jgi:hypothetical protein